MVKVILCQHISNLGEMGDTISVSDGYARNYLIPRKLAVSVHSASAKQIEHELRRIRKQEEKLRIQLREIAQKLEGITLEVKARAGEDEKLFGSVTAAQIATHLKALGYEVDRKQLLLDQPIKSLGIYTVPVRLHSGVEANLKVWVLPETPEELPTESHEEPSPGPSK